MPSRRALLAGAAGLIAAGGLAETIHLGPITAPEPAPDTWPQVRYGPANTAGNPDAVIPEEPTIDWQAVALPSSNDTCVVVGPDTVYLGGAGVAAFQRADGSKRWRAEAPGHFLSLVGGTLFGASRSTPPGVDAGTIGPVAIEVADGSLRWQADEQRRIYHLLASDGAVYVGDHGRLLAFDSKTGRRRWSIARGYDAETFPMVHRGTLYGGLERLVRFEPRSLLDLTTLSGPAMRWETDYFDEMGPPTAVTDRIVFGSYQTHPTRRDPALVAFDTETGEQRWGVFEQKPEDEFFQVSTPAVVGIDGFVGLRGSGDDHRRYAIAKVTLTDGVVRWERALDQRVWQVAAGKERVVIGTAVPQDHPEAPKGSVRAYDRGNGREQWRIPTESPVGSLALADGTVFASTVRGGLLALR